MGNLINLLGKQVIDFPFGKAGGWFPFIGEMCYGLISWIYGNGILGYGLAIIIFTILLKLILSPLDFINRYFSKKNGIAMAKMKPDLDAVKQQYGNEPAKMMAMQQEVYKKHDYHMGGFLMFMLLNMFVIMAVFFSVFGALNDIADLNVKNTVKSLQADYKTYNNTEEFDAKINKTYGERMIGFIWIKNIWRADTPWTSANVTREEYIAYANKTGYADIKDGEGKVTSSINDQLGKEFDKIFGVVKPDQKRDWNGLMILIIFAGTTTWASTVLNSMITTKKREAEKPKEEVVDYSMRDAKNRADQTAPAIDPVMMNRIMKFVLPAIMVFFTMMSTAALAIYIITSSVMGTLTTLAFNKPVDKLLEMQEKKKSARSTEVDPKIINPHSKYFKSKRK